MATFEPAGPALMNGFLRVFLLALRYRFTLAGLIITALLVGVLWGGNIAVVYPFIEVIVYGKTVPEWTRTGIDGQRQKILETQALIDDLRKQTTDAQQDNARQAAREL